MKQLQRRTTLAFGAVAVMLGIAIVVQTAREGGGVGYLIGVMFAALGVGRIYLLRRR
jgi:phosphotransferase system  glucose/maltose/N-acetylglucosamine-specific IIC component